MLELQCIFNSFPGDQTHNTLDLNITLESISSSMTSHFCLFISVLEMDGATPVSALEVEEMYNEY